jgi:hypothetical protein
MINLWGDPLFRLILDEKWRDGERMRLVMARREPGLASRMVAALGGVLMWAGRRMQTAARPTAPIYVVDPCNGCAN